MDTGGFAGDVKRNSFLCADQMMLRREPPLSRGSMQCLFLLLGSAKRPICFERYSNAVLAGNRVAI